MRVEIRQFLTLARLSFQEVLRQPISLLLESGCLCIIFLLPFLITHSLENLERLVRDSALALHFVTGLLLALAMSCSSVRDEQLRGTADLILSKPVSRGLFFLAKCAGIAVAVLTVSITTCCFVLMSCSVARKYDTEPYFEPFTVTCQSLVLAGAFTYGLFGNYTKGKSFTSLVHRGLFLGSLIACSGLGLLAGNGRSAGSGSFLSAEIIASASCLTLAMLLLVSVATCASIKLRTGIALVGCAGLFLFGLFSDVLSENIHKPERVWGSWLLRLVPDWQSFWIVDPASYSSKGLFEYVALCGLYTASYVLGVLMLGLFISRSLEV